MHTHRVTVGLVTVLVMACCLVLGGFASPASAKTIVVTTLTDTADPPFNADGACGSGTVRDLPGADGLISLIPWSGTSFTGSRPLPARAR